MFEPAGVDTLDPYIMQLTRSHSSHRLTTSSGMSSPSSRIQQAAAQWPCGWSRSYSWRCQPPQLAQLPNTIATDIVGTHRSPTPGTCGCRIRCGAQKRHTRNPVRPRLRFETPDVRRQGGPGLTPIVLVVPQPTAAAVCQGSERVAASPMTRSWRPSSSAGERCVHDAVSR